MTQVPTLSPCPRCGATPLQYTSQGECTLHPEIVRHPDNDCELRFATYRRRAHEGALAWNGWCVEQGRAAR